MSKGTVHTAWVQSSNTVTFRAPYEGEQHGELVLRVSPRHGSDIIFRIEKGQLLVRSYEESDVLVRFDDHDAEKFSAIGAADGSSEVMFIQNFQRFSRKMKAARRVRIAPEVYHEGAPTFEFDVSGFSESKFRPG